MAEDKKTYSALEAARAIGAALRKHLDENATDLATPKTVALDDAMKALAKSIQERIDAFADELVELRKMEGALEMQPADMTDPAAANGDLCPTCGQLDEPGFCQCLGAEMQKSHPIGWSPAPGAIGTARTVVGVARNTLHNPESGVQQGLDIATQRAAAAEARAKTATADAHPFGKSEDFIDLKHENDRKKRIKNVGAVGVLPDDKEPEEVEGSGEGNGTAPKKGKPLQKDVMNPGKKQAPMAAPKMPKAAPPSMGASAKPAGVPGAPKPPKAPGASGAAFGKDEFRPSKEGGKLKKGPGKWRDYYSSRSKAAADAAAWDKAHGGTGGAPQVEPGVSPPKLNTKDFQTDYADFMPPGRFSKNELGDCALCKKAEHAGPCEQ